MTTLRSYVTLRVSTESLLKLEEEFHRMLGLVDETASTPEQRQALRGQLTFTNYLRAKLELSLASEAQVLAHIVTNGIRRGRPRERND